jgi:7-carboxy-7-deazaguanine synthase
MSAARPLRVSEIFESIQGEGPCAGTASVFLRLATCNLRCKWCDTKYTWDWTAYNYDDEVHPMSVADVTERVHRSASKHLVITGGEPLLQRRELESLVVELSPAFYVEVETNGTLEPGAALARRVDQWNVSPKLENSGEPIDRRLDTDVLVEFLKTKRAFLKLVVSGDGDRAEVEAIVRELGWPRDRTLLMPLAATRAELDAKTPLVMELAVRIGVGVSPRLHVLRWDGKRGV